MKRQVNLVYEDGDFTELYYGSDSELAAKIAADFRKVIKKYKLPLKVENRKPHLSTDPLGCPNGGG